MPRSARSLLLAAAASGAFVPAAGAFAPQHAKRCALTTAGAARPSPFRPLRMAAGDEDIDQAAEKEDALNAAIGAMFGADPSMSESPDVTRERIQTLVDGNSVLLFMKGSRIFPQCGFSNTAVQILESFSVDFHTVDVLSDLAIREGVKVFSQWPTIPQLYVDGEFIGGSDIMVEMYQSGELKELIETAKEA